MSSCRNQQNTEKLALLFGQNQIISQTVVRAMIYCSRMLAMENKSSTLSALESKTYERIHYGKSTADSIPTSD